MCLTVSKDGSVADVEIIEGDTEKPILAFHFPYKKGDEQAMKAAVDAGRNARLREREVHVAITVS